MGQLRGSGRDRASRAEGEMAWTVAPGPQSGSDVTIRLWWRLMGPLAQFGRAALVQDLVRRVSQDFTRNLDASLAGKAPMPARAVGLFTMLWELLKSRLFRRGNR